MIKETITYVDYDDVERTEDFYFNLTKVELTEMEVGFEGGMAKKLEKIIQCLDRQQMVEMFKDLILRSYGEKSPDGKRFIKSKELSDAFSQTEAFVELYLKITDSTEAAVEFVNGIIPKMPN